MISQRELTNLDILFIIKKIQKELVQNHARLDHFYDLDTKFIFRFKLKEGKKDLVFLPPRYLFLRDREKIESEPTPFAISVKNLLANKIIKDIRQLNNDRIIELEFENGSIILECTKKGNLILISEGKIKNIKFKIEEKERILETGKEYSTPKNEKREVKKEQIIQILKMQELQNEKIVVAISRNIQFPAFYLNKIFESEGWDPKKKIMEFNDYEKERIAYRIEEFYYNLLDNKIKPILKDDELFLVDERLMGKIENYKEIDLFKAFEEAYDFEMTSLQDIEKTKRINRLLNRLKHQEERVKQLEIQIKEEKEKGEWIIKHAYEITELIKKYKDIKSRKDKSEMEKFLKENGLEIVKNGIKIKVDN
ncbi:MAG: NFACT family protein [Candidatus Micrarchaeia archaeon]